MARAPSSMSAYCEPVSVLALGAVMGLGDLDAETLRRWFGDLATGGANFEQDPEKQAVADATSAEIDGRIGPLLDRLEREPDESVLSHMLAADATRAEVLSNLKLILLGGMQEPGPRARDLLCGRSSPIPRRWRGSAPTTASSARRSRRRFAGTRPSAPRRAR